MNPDLRAKNIAYIFQPRKTIEQKNSSCGTIHCRSNSTPELMKQSAQVFMHKFIWH